MQLHLDTDWPRKFPPLPKNAILSSSPVLVNHLEPVFAPFQELATSSLFNNMEINFGKENWNGSKSVFVCIDWKASTVNINMLLMA